MLKRLAVPFRFAVFVTGTVDTHSMNCWPKEGHKEHAKNSVSSEHLPFCPTVLESEVSSGRPASTPSSGSGIPPVGAS